MLWCRIRLVLLGLILCVVHVVSGPCGQTFTDPASSGLLADVVIEGKVRKLMEPGPYGNYEIIVAVRKNILKGKELINKGKRVKKITIGRFQDGEEDEEQCVGSVQKDRTYFFFLEKSSDPQGLKFENKALPVKKTRKVRRLLQKVLCDGSKCAMKPKIRKLNGPGGVSEGSKMTLKCSAKGKPDPVFKWYKDGVLLKPKKGVRIHYRKRQSKLQIRRASQDDEGVYQCVATNVIGEAKQNFTVKVSKNSRQATRCKSQTFCLNGGTCMFSSDLDITFCECPKRFAGSRCEKEVPDPSTYGGPVSATLLYERTLIIIGIVIAVLVFIAICIASYFLAKRRHKRFEERRKRKMARRAEKGTTERIEDNSRQPLTSSKDPSYGRKNISSNFGEGHIVIQAPPAHVHPKKESKAFQPEQQPLLRQQQPTLGADGRLEADGDRPSSRGRLIASSVYENIEEPRPPPLTECVAFPKNVTTASVHPPESFEMNAIGDKNDNKIMDKTETDKGSPCVNDNEDDSSPSDSSDLPPPSTRHPRSYHQIEDENMPPPYQATLITVPTTPASSSTPSPPPLPPHHFQDDASSRGENDTAVEPLLPKHDSYFPPHDLDHNQQHPRPSESKSDKDLYRHNILGSKKQSSLDTPRYGNDFLENDKLLKKHPKVSHSNTFPLKSKVNGTGLELGYSDSDSEDDEEVPYKQQLDLYISEEDLGLSKENLINSSFNSVLSPSRQASCEERVTGLLPASKLSRPEMRKHLSEEGPANNLFSNKSHGLHLQDYSRSRSLDDPLSSVTSQETRHYPGRLNSTMAGSPEVETYGIAQQPPPFLNHDYAYDPNEDSTPWDGEPNRTDGFLNLSEEEKDRLLRLKDVCPDSQPIPI